MTTTLEEGEGSASRPGRSSPPGKTRYPLYRRLAGPQGRSEQVRKISSPPGLDPRTVQPVASHYTDWATRPISCYEVFFKLRKFCQRYRIFSRKPLFCLVGPITFPWQVGNRGNILNECFVLITWLARCYSATINGCTYNIHCALHLLKHWNLLIRS